MSVPNPNTTQLDTMKNTRKSAWINSALTLLSGVVISILIGVAYGHHYYYYLGLSVWAQGFCFIFPGIFGLIASGVKRQAMYIVAIVVGSIGLGSFLLSLIWLWGIPHWLLRSEDTLGYGIGLILMWILGSITVLIMTVNMGMLNKSDRLPGVIIQPHGMAQPMIMTTAPGYPNQMIITTAQAYPGAVTVAHNYPAPMAPQLTAGQMAPQGQSNQMMPPVYSAPMVPQPGAYGYQPVQAYAQPPPEYPGK